MRQHPRHIDQQSLSSWNWFAPWNFELYLPDCSLGEPTCSIGLLRVNVSFRCSRVSLLRTVALGQTPTALDIVIRNGHVIDGTGAPWYRADVGIRYGRIVAIGKVNQSAKVIYDATGLAVAPGFIDMLGQSEFNILVDNLAASKILQGVTTEVTGEGGSIAPLNERMIGDGGVRNGKTPFKQFGVEPSWRTLAECFSLLENKIHPAINIATFVGAGGVRDYVIGRDDRAATPAELDSMRQLVAQAMKEGALGLSTSLQYVPDRFASTEEIAELAKIASGFGGIYVTHMRYEADGLSDSLNEVFTIAEEAHIPAEIFHLKTAGNKTGGEAQKRSNDWIRREPGDSISRPIPTLIRGHPIHSTHACLFGCARAGPKRWSLA